MRVLKLLAGSREDWAARQPAENLQLLRLQVSYRRRRRRRQPPFLLSHCAHCPWRGRANTSPSSSSPTAPSCALTRRPFLFRSLLQNPELAGEGQWVHCTAVPEAGGLLLATAATPKLLGGSAFWQAVVFLARHDAEGSLGLILNRPTNDRVGRGPDGWPVPVLVSAPALLPAACVAKWAQSSMPPVLSI